MSIQLWAGLHLGVDAKRLRAQGVQCPYSIGHVAVLSAMRAATDDIFLERAKAPVRQVTMCVPANSWDRWAIELPPELKRLRSGKLDRVVMAFESESDATQFSRIGGGGDGLRLLWSGR